MRVITIDSILFMIEIVNSDISHCVHGIYINIWDTLPGYNSQHITHCTVDQLKLKLFEPNEISIFFLNLAALNIYQEALTVCSPFHGDWPTILLESELGVFLIVWPHNPRPPSSIQLIMDVNEFKWCNIYYKVLT